MSTSRRNENPFRVVRASAGTGKTYQLSSRYIGLLNQDVAVDEILATTFTKKAAGEITERVLLRLAKAVCNSGDLQEMAIACTGCGLARSTVTLLNWQPSAAWSWVSHQAGK
jgi:ATP-dependent helicase/nuclease subunit A